MDDELLLSVFNLVNKRIARFPSKSIAGEYI